MTIVVGQYPPAVTPPGGEPGRADGAAAAGVMEWSGMGAPWCSRFGTRGFRVADGSSRLLMRDPRPCADELRQVTLAPCRWTR
jgi:hypothetical protein